MSKENVEAFKRGIEASNRRDFETLLERLDPEVEWYPALLASLEGKATVYHGREGVRQWLQEVYEVLAEIHTEFSEIRDLGTRVVAIGHIRTRGKESGAETESPLAYVIDYKDAKATRVQSYLDPQAALDALTTVWIKILSPRSLDTFE
jgi:ketosteroid isomerase-like protein